MSITWQPADLIEKLYFLMIYDQVMEKARELGCDGVKDVHITDEGLVSGGPNKVNQSVSVTYQGEGTRFFY